MSNITEYYEIIAQKQEEAYALRFTPVDKRGSDHSKKMRDIKKAIREARISIGKELSQRMKK